jgi:hypothetical protein
VRPSTLARRSPTPGTIVRAILNNYAFTFTVKTDFPPIRSASVSPDSFGLFLFSHLLSLKAFGLELQLVEVLL